MKEVGFLLFFIYFSYAANWYISPFGNNNYSGTSPSTPFADLKTALGKSSIGDTINVATGTYNGPNNVGLSITGVNIIGTSGSGTTIFQGSSTVTSIFKLYADATLQGLSANTATNGVEIATGNSTTLIDISVSSVSVGILLNQAQKLTLSKFKASNSVSNGIAFSSSSSTKTISITDSTFYARTGLVYTSNLVLSTLDINYTVFESQVIGSRGIFISVTTAAPFNVTISNSSFTNYNIPTGTNSGAALYLTASTSIKANASIISTQFTSNRAQYGPSLYTYGFSGLYLSSVTVFNSTSLTAGGGFYISTTRETVIENSEFRNCTAQGTGSSAGSGGAIYFSAATSIFIQNSAFLDNAATGGFGGAIYHPTASSSALLTVYNCDFNNSYAQSSGGAIAAYGQLTVNSTLLAGNTAGSTGGAIYYSGANVGTSYSIYSDYISNSATSGGAIYSNSGSLTLNNGTFSFNYASSLGGAIYCGSTMFSLYEAAFDSNYAAGSYGGGMYATTSSSVNLAASEFSKNSAVSVGGGLYCNSNAGVLMNGVVFSDNTATTGSAYACSSCLVTVASVYVDPDNTVSCVSQ